MFEPLNTFLGKDYMRQDLVEEWRRTLPHSVMVNFKSESHIINFFLYIYIPVSTSVSTVASVALGNSNIDPLISIAKLCPP